MMDPDRHKKNITDPLALHRDMQTTITAKTWNFHPFLPLLGGHLTFLDSDPDSGSGFFKPVEYNTLLSRLLICFWSDYFTLQPHQLSGRALFMCKIEEKRWRRYPKVESVKRADVALREKSPSLPLFLLLLYYSPNFLALRTEVIHTVSHVVIYYTVRCLFRKKKKSWNCKCRNLCKAVRQEIREKSFPHLLPRGSIF